MRGLEIERLAGSEASLQRRAANLKRTSQYVRQHSR